MTNALQHGIADRLTDSTVAIVEEIHGIRAEMQRVCAVLDEPQIIPYRGAIIRLERSEKGYTCDAGSEWAARQIGYAFAKYWFLPATPEIIFRGTEQQGDTWRASFDVYIGD